MKLRDIDAYGYSIIAPKTAIKHIRKVLQTCYIINWSDLSSNDVYILNSKVYNVVTNHISKTIILLPQ